MVYQVQLTHIYMYRRVLENYNMMRSQLAQKIGMLVIISDLMPQMVSFLQLCNWLTRWINLSDAVQQGSFPDDNIAFHLFMDVVDWYASESHSIQYSKSVNRFWLVGYKLFGEKFLCFLGGVKKNETVNFIVKFDLWNVVYWHVSHLYWHVFGVLVLLFGVPVLLMSTVSLTDRSITVFSANGHKIFWFWFIHDYIKSHLISK